jgi:hypothetical protein
MMRRNPRARGHAEQDRRRGHGGSPAVRRIVGAVLMLAALRCQAQHPAAATQLGVAHIGGRYAFTEKDFLIEGAEAVRSLGARCLKISLSLDTDNPSPSLYPFGSRWPEVTSLDALADTPAYRSVFAMDFDTFILTSFRPGRPAGYWRTGFTEADEQAETECFAALTEQLLRRHATTRKTFVIQNWEGDWAVRGNFDPAVSPTRDATANMVRWLAARQRGVARGRRAVAANGPRVVHACEVNLVRQAMERGAPSVTTDVLPHVPLDLVSYSAWDTKDSPHDFGRALDFILRHKPSTEPFGAHGVYVGEFGLPESEASPREVLDRTAALLAQAERRGCPYAVYWQLYCNEPLVKDPKSNADYKGFWLIRPDGTRSPVCDLLRPAAADSQGR